MNLKCDGVFEGGGVKGTGFAGAISAIEASGYNFENVVGTSAGAIVASLLAVGFKAKELKLEIDNLDYKLLRQKSFLDKFSYPGKIISIFKNFGIYNTEYFEHWLSSLFLKKNKILFKDIKTKYQNIKYKYKFQAIASDLTDRKLLILPRDLVNFGINTDEFPIAKAVTMSMSIPVFFKPTYLKDLNGKKHVIVDGGLLSNYPVWLLDDGTSNPPWPTFGFKFSNDKLQGSDVPINNFIDYSKSIVSTLLEAPNNFHISMSKGDFQRTIMIPTEVMVKDKLKNINTTYFDITSEEKMLLFKNGFDAATNFLEKWNFSDWKKRFRV